MKSSSTKLMPKSLLPITLVALALHSPTRLHAIPCTPFWWAPTGFICEDSGDRPPCETCECPVGGPGGGGPNGCLSCGNLGGPTVGGQGAGGNDEGIYTAGNQGMAYFWVSEPYKI